MDITKALKLLKQKSQDYFKPTEKVRARDVFREMAEQVTSGSPLRNMPSQSESEANNKVQQAYDKSSLLDKITGGYKKNVDEGTKKLATDYGNKQLSTVGGITEPLKAGIADDALNLLKSKAGTIKDAADNILYHGTRKNIEGNLRLNNISPDYITDKPYLSLTDNMDQAKNYGNVIKLKDKGIKILDVSDIKVNHTGDLFPDVDMSTSKLKGKEFQLAEDILTGQMDANDLIKYGYDGIKFPVKLLTQEETPGNEIRIVNPDALKKIEQFTENKKPVEYLRNKGKYAGSRSKVVPKEKLNDLEASLTDLNNVNSYDPSTQINIINDADKQLAKLGITTKSVQETKDAILNLLKENKHFDVDTTPTIKSSLLKNVEGMPLDKKRVSEYMQMIKKGEKIEPIKIIRRGGKYEIEDGKHRVQAYSNLGIKDIPYELVGWAKGK